MKGHPLRRLKPLGAIAAMWRLPRPGSFPATLRRFNAENAVNARVRRVRSYRDGANGQTVRAQEHRNRGRVAPTGTDSILREVPLPTRLNLKTCRSVWRPRRFSTQ